MYLTGLLLTLTPRLTELLMMKQLCTISPMMMGHRRGNLMALSNNAITSERLDYHTNTLGII